MDPTDTAVPAPAPDDALAGAVGATLESAGVAGWGVCSADPFLDVREGLEARVASGANGRLRFTFGDPERATDVRRSFDWAERLVVAAVSYLPAAGDPGPPRPGTGRIARFATEDHYEPLRSALARAAGVLHDAGHRADVLCDDNRLVDRAAAVRAGVGWWGKNTMVLTPGAGPWLLLGSVVTDALLPESEPMRRDCGRCDACLPACPTGALVEPGVLDARLCLAHWLQAPGDIPPDLREAVGDRVYGCDDCLDACPPGGRLLDATRTSLGESPLPRPGRVDLLDLLAMEDAGLLETHDHWYVPRRDPAYLRRNLLVALGNSGGPGAVEVAGRHLGHPKPMIRRHAAWALGRLGGPEAAGLLTEAAARESDPETAAEIATAVAAAR